MNQGESRNSWDLVVRVNPLVVIPYKHRIARYGRYRYGTNTHRAAQVSAAGLGLIVVQHSVSSWVAVRFYAVGVVR